MHRQSRIKRDKRFMASLIMIGMLPCSLKAQYRPAVSRREQSQNKTDVQISVLEAYLNFMLSHNAHPNYAYFLEVSPQSHVKSIARKQLLHKLARHVPPVFAVGRRVKYGPGFSDKKTKRAAMIYSINALKWMSVNIVEVDGGWQTGGLSGVRAIYKLVLTRKHWRVTSQHIYRRN